MADGYGGLTHDGDGYGAATERNWPHHDHGTWVTEVELDRRKLTNSIEDVIESLFY